MSEEFDSEIDDPFTRLPISIWEIGLTGNEMIVLSRILFRAGFRGQCFESRASIAEACCVTERTVGTVFAELERLNILQIIRRQSEKKPNLIRVKKPAVWISKRKKTAEKDMTQENISYLRGNDFLSTQENISYGTRSHELDSLELDSHKEIAQLKTIASAEAAATCQALTVSQGENSPPDPTLTSKAEPKTSETWKTYSEWYEKRYKVQPVRNQKVNSQLKQFCERVGYEEAPKIIAFYLLQNDYWYVKQMHTIGIALSEAEKLVAGYRRGSLTTKREAEYIDKTSSRKSWIDQVLDVIEAEDAQNGGTI